MEELQLRPIEKKALIKRKFLGIPLFILMVFGIVMVAAVGTYYYYFYYTIQADIMLNYPNIGRHAHNINNELIITGGLNPKLNCTAGQFCTTDNISITNPTTDNQTVDLSQWLYQTYSEDGSWSGQWVQDYKVCLEGDLIKCFDNNNYWESISIKMEPNSTITFRAKYNISLDNIPTPILNCTLGEPCIWTGNSTDLQANIQISSNMTEY